MVSYTKDLNGRIVSYIEWQILDAFGQFKDMGEYIYIQEIWCHEDRNLVDELPKLISLICVNKFSQNAIYVYWLREKYNDRRSRIYNVSDFIDKFIERRKSWEAKEVQHHHR